MSSRMIYLLFEHDLVEPMELSEAIMNTQYYDKVEDFTDLSYNEHACLASDKIDDRDSDVESCDGEYEDKDMCEDVSEGEEELDCP